MTEKLHFKPVFVQNVNVRNFATLMDRLKLDEEEGRMGAVKGMAGLGKSRTAQHWHAQNPSIYMRMLGVWASSPLGFLQALLKELGHKQAPHSTSRCFTLLLDLMIGHPQPLFLDEVDRLPGRFVDMIRDLTDLTAAPVVLIGEENLDDMLAKNTRVWSRVAAQMEFKALGEADVIVYAKQVSELDLNGEVARILHRADNRSLTRGNLRVTKRAILTLVQMCNAEGTRVVTPEMAKIAVDVALGGK